MMLKQMYMEFSNFSKYGSSLSLLLARVVVAYGFYKPAMMKWHDIDSVAKWFETMGVMLPTISAYIVATTELVGVILLILGLFTRLISIPLMVVMVVAIVSVHWTNGFSVVDNGFEIPLYYMLFLFIFLSHGAGAFSLDRLIFGEKS